MLLFPDIFSHQFQQVGQGHDGPAHDKVVFVFMFFHAAVLKDDIGQSYRFGYALGHLNFLAHPVNQMKPAFGKENSQGNTGKSAAGTHVENRRAVGELDGLGNAQRVEYVVQIEVVDILARDYVNLGIPVGI